jgi:uncharacterized BrkB/YihY/UPF0761 family membrane protein
MLSNPLVRLGIVGAAVWAAYRWAPNATLKTAAISVGAIAAAKQIPVVKEFV